MHRRLIFAPCCETRAGGDIGFVEIADEDGQPPSDGKIKPGLPTEAWAGEPVGNYVTCIHEAGHAIAALIAGQYVHRVTVLPIPRTSIVWHADISNGARAVVLLIGRHAGNWTSRFRVRLLDDEWDWYRASAAAGTNGGCDFCEATNLARGEVGDEDTVRWLREREGEALALLDNPTTWHAIRQVADALKERSRLSGHEVRSIARAAGLEFNAVDLADHMEEIND